MKSFVVIGLGRFGEAVAEQLFNMGYEVLAIDKNIDRVNAAADKVTRAVMGDTKSHSVLELLGVKNYDCAVVAIGESISDSVMTALLLKEMGVKRVVCKAKDFDHKKLLLKIGADTVIIPEYEYGLKTAAKLVSDDFMDIMDLSDKYSVADIRVPSDWIGKSIAELDVRREYEINIVAVKSGGDINVNPKSDCVFRENDVITAVGEKAVMSRLDGKR